jgi:hypothetical protein|tara:strand:- start:47 stop:1432 length:1386 start_codon:yes stop_codon:yes gene_type:complete
MKLYLILSISIIFRISCSAQFGSQQIISDGPNIPNDIYVADIDNDGYPDVLVSTQTQISWYKNINGAGEFGQEQLIAQNPEELGSSVSASDFDGDGDLDVLSTFIDGSPAQNRENRVVWIENLDGQGTFGPQKIISLDAYRPTDAVATDIDGDGDMDVFSISRGDDKVAWYRNMDGLGNFGPQVLISQELDFPIHGIASDFDNDGDIDVLSHSLHDDKIGWFKNIDGAGNFGSLEIISNNVDFPSEIFAADLDGDDDLDVISTSKNDNKIAWYENINGNFGTQQIITTLVNEPNIIFASDLDNDGDLDLISGSSANGSYSIVSIFNTDGQGNFQEPELISDAVSYPNGIFVNDIDGDSDNDILSTSQMDRKVAWYENLSILGIESVNTSQTVIYPNPFDHRIIISGNDKIIEFKLFDVFGNVLDCKLESNQINTTNLSTGIYLLELTNGNGFREFFKIVKR